MDFKASLKKLTDALDPERHAHEIRLLKRCRNRNELEDLARDGWLTPERPGKRLRLMKHGSGTFLVLEYDQGWGTTLVMSDFWTR